KNTHELKRHISGVEDTIKITRAMQMIATSKLYRAREKCENSYRYLKELRNILSAAAAHESVREHPFLREHKSGKTALFVVAGDKGLCGDFNHRILDFADKFAAEHEVSKIFALGQETREHYEKKGFPLSNFYIHMASEPHAFDAISVANDIVNMFRSGEYKEVYIVYTRTPSPSTQEPTAKRLIPIPLPEHEISTVCPVLEPNTRAALDNFLSQYLMAEIYSALADSAMAIHFKRMTSMRQSTENGEELLAELTAQYNHERQESITNELIDASASAFRN
ncbi:MAG: ATP synthase F1 subunit gamma, partial [Christensenellaceae bacterium]